VNRRGLERVCVVDRRFGFLLVLTLLWMVLASPRSLSSVLGTMEVALTFFSYFLRCDLLTFLFCGSCAVL